jgi:hypothetical protein
MTPRLARDKAKTPVHHDGSGKSQDRKRDEDEARHHPELKILPHPEHHPQDHPAGLPLHHPHTRPEEHALDTDHGTHEDRPVPGKIMKKSKRPGT